MMAVCHASRRGSSAPRFSTHGGGGVDRSARNYRQPEAISSSSSSSAVIVENGFHLHRPKKQLNRKPLKRSKLLQGMMPGKSTTTAVERNSSRETVAAAAAGSAACRRDLLAACEEGNVERMEEILSSGCVDPHDEALLKGKPPLYWAVVRGKLPMVKVLVENYDCNPRFVTDHSGTTLFHAACSRGHDDVARYLSTLGGVETHTSRKDGSTPLMAACHYGHLSVVKFLVQDLGCETQIPVSCSSEGTLLHLACSNNDAQASRYLVSHCGLDPYAKRQYGETPMHVASAKGNLDVVRYLDVELGCPIDVVDETGNTPLHLSAQNNHHTVVRYIIERGGKVDEPNHRGFTPLMLACRYGKMEAARVLLEVGKADPNHRNSADESLLHCSRDQGIITELIRHGADTTNFVSSLLNNTTRGTSSNEEALVRMFIIGHPTAGKSTLVEALKEVKGGIQGHIFKGRKVTGVAPSTAGIVPMEIESSELGRVLLFDFAGQNEYYASHAALLEASKTSAPLFVLVVNLLESEEEINFRISFWLSFINNHHVPGASMAHMAIIGSHKDKLRKLCPHVYRKKIAAVEISVKSKVREYSRLKMIGFFPLDCRKPQKHIKLRSKLRESCKELRSNSEVDGCCHVLSIFLAQKFAGEITCNLGRLVAEIKHSDFALPCTPQRLCELIEALGERQNILFLRNSTHIDQSWIVLEVDTLFAKINGCIFAPINFKEHRFGSDSGTGIVSWSHIQSSVRELNLDPELVVAFLKKLEFCEEVSEPEVLALIQKGTSLAVVGKGHRRSSLPASHGLDVTTVPSRSVTTPGRYCSVAMKGRGRRESSASNPHIQIKDDIGLRKPPPPPSPLSGSMKSQQVETLLSPNGLISSNGVTTTSHDSTISERHLPNFHASLEKIHKNSSTISPTNSMLHVPIAQQRKTLTNSNPEFDHQVERDFSGGLLDERRANSCQDLSAPSPCETRFFFFPGLMRHERPGDENDESIWSLDDSFVYHTGWCMKVSHADQFFTPRLLQILLLRIAFGFATTTTRTQFNGGTSMDPTKRQCTVWKNGIRWLDRDGIETVVEMVEQDRAVVVLMRGKPGSELHCVKLRSNLVHLITEIKQKFCPNLSINQFLIDPKDFANQPYPFSSSRSLNSLTLYDISTMATSLVDIKEWVIDTKGATFGHMSALLYFDPLMNLGRDLLQMLCSDESDYVMDDKLYEFLHDYSLSHFTAARELSLVLKVRKTPLPIVQPLLSSIQPCSSGSTQSLGDACSLHSVISSVNSIHLNPSLKGIYYHQLCGVERRGSNECMEVLDKWWHSSSSLTLTDFRVHLQSYSLFRDIDLLEFICSSEADESLDSQ